MTYPSTTQPPAIRLTTRVPYSGSHISIRIDVYPFATHRAGDIHGRRLQVGYGGSRTMSDKLFRSVMVAYPRVVWITLLESDVYLAGFMNHLQRRKPWGKNKSQWNGLNTTTPHVVANLCNKLHSANPTTMSPQAMSGIHSTHGYTRK